MVNRKSPAIKPGIFEVTTNFYFLKSFSMVLSFDLTT